LDLFKALILGILQGATEFLPISSSAHLVLVPWWLNWDEPPLIFDVMVHLGTLVAVLLYFWRDWLTLLRAGVHALRKHSIQDPDARLLVWIIVGTVPAAIAGGLFEKFFEARFADPAMVAFELVVTAGILVWAERLQVANPPEDPLDQNATVHRIGALNALIIGVAQAIAIFPGISRSGSTIAVGMWRGLPRAASARFSFLLSAPIIFGAGVKQGLDVLLGNVTLSHNLDITLIAGFVSAAVVGYSCIWFLMRLLQQRRLYGFAVYCAAFGTLSLLVALLA